MRSAMPQWAPDIDAKDTNPRRLHAEWFAHIPSGLIMQHNAVSETQIVDRYMTGDKTNGNQDYFG